MQARIECDTLTGLHLFAVELELRSFRGAFEIDGHRRNRPLKLR